MIVPSDALRELLEQHRALRALMDACDGLADDVDAGRGDVGALVREVARLRLAFDAHNRHEEHVLLQVLREIDSFGDVRIDSMSSDHAGEHRALRSRLGGGATAELRATLFDLRAHLAAEERVFLSARVLRDDVVNVESTG